MTAKLSGSYWWPSFFWMLAKKQERIASSSWGGMHSTFCTMLRCTFHSLKTFSQGFVLLEVFWFCFLPLRFASFSWQYGKSLICSDITEKVIRNGKLWQISGAKLCHCQLQTAATVLMLCFDAMLCGREFFVSRLQPIKTSHFWQGTCGCHWNFRGVLVWELEGASEFNGSNSLFWASNLVKSMMNIFGTYLFHSVVVNYLSLFGLLKYMSFTTASGKTWQAFLMNFQMMNKQVFYSFERWACVWSMTLQQLWRWQILICDFRLYSFRRS